jgi:hypothetical protein
MVPKSPNQVAPQAIPADRGGMGADAILLGLKEERSKITS